MLIEVSKHLQGYSFVVDGNKNILIGDFTKERFTKMEKIPLKEIGYVELEA